MMHPPIIRLGPPPETQKEPIVALFQREGWVILERVYGKGRGNWSYEVPNSQGQRQLVFTTAITCWMPQDGT